MDARVEMLCENLTSLRRSDLEPLPNAAKLNTNVVALAEILTKFLPALPIAVRQMEKNREAEKLMQDVTKLADELENLLNKLEYEVQLSRARLMVRNYSAARLVGCFNPTFYISRRLQKRLANVEVEFRRLVLHSASVEQPDRGPSATFDRDDNLRDIVERLQSDDDQSIAVHCITGSPGIGKTTLARLAYKKLEPKFDVRAWVVVSENFDGHRVTKDLLKQLGTSHTRGSGSTEKQLQRYLSDKKFFFVLDHVGEIDSLTWHNFMNPLASAARGSRVLMTMSTTPDADGNTTTSLSPTFKMQRHELDRLNDEDCWSLLASVAFPDRNPCDYSHLVSIGKEMVGKCKGQPRAVKVLGGILKYKMTEPEWESAFDTIPLEQFMDYDDFSPTMKRCFAYCTIFPKDYKVHKETLIQFWIAEGLVQEHRRITTLETIAETYFLNLQSKSFLLHSNKDEGVSMDPSHGNLSRLVSGQAYFHYNRDTSVHPKNSPTSSSAAADDHSPENIRYMSYVYDISTQLEPLSPYKHLRTLLLVCSPASRRAIYSDQVIPDDLFTNFQELRTLSLSGLPIQTLPNSIRKLEKLRLLDVSHTLIEKILDLTIASCNHLLTLKLNDCVYLAELPSMENLINLRHLDISGSNNIKAMPQGIGRLANLRSLSKFIVRGVNGPQIQELRDLVHLSGNLSISGMQNVIESRDANEANLANKTFIRELILEWTTKFSELRDKNVETEVLENLKARSNLETLDIICYGGTRFPQWISLCHKLVRVTLSNCRNCDSLPPFLGQLPLLKALSIEGMNELKRIGAEFCGDVTPFPSLETLEFKNMPCWEEWSFSSTEFTREYPRLRMLRLERCPKLKELKVRMKNLELLTINECQELTAVSLENLPKLLELDIQHCSNLKDMPGQFRSLKKLRIWGCQNLTLLSNIDPAGEEFPLLLELDIQNCTRLRELPGKFPLLQKLRITKCNELSKISTCPKLADFILEECDELTLLNEVELGSLTSMVISQLPNFEYPCTQLLQSLSELINLEISKCVNLNALTEKECRSQALSSLQRLVIDGCPKLEQLPDDIISCFPSLKELIVVGCVGLECFPDTSLPPLLKRLVIGKCKHLKSLPSRIFNTSLEYVEVYGCRSLVSLSDNGNKLPLTLRLLSVSDCTSLRSLPAGLNRRNDSLTSLRIRDSPSVQDFPQQGLPCNIRSLTIINCGNFKPMSEWGLHKLECLRSFSFGGCPELVHLEGVKLPNLVGTLLLKGLPRLESFSGLLQSLESLDILTIRDCPRLEIKTEETLPVSLSCLYVSNCPTLRQKCRYEKGDDWSKIKDIPLIEFDFHQLVKKRG